MTPSDRGEHAEEAPMSCDERRLKEALYALNRALPDEMDAYLGDDNDELAAENVRRLVRVRDEVFALGSELYGWKD